MNILKRYNWKKVLSVTVWLLISCATLFLLVSAVTRTDKRLCKGIEIRIAGAKNNFFLDKEDIRKIIFTYAGSTLEGLPVADMNLREVEQALERDIWIRDAELFIDNNAILQVDVDEREPIARVYALTGGSFYIDSSLKVLPLSEKVTARVPVFTGFPTATKIMSAEEKELLKGIRSLGLKLYSDPFLMAMIDQVAITQRGRFEMYPKIGDHVVLFGESDDADAKMEKLKLFYKKVLPKEGWNRYSKVNLMYHNQVVASVRSKQEVASDSLRTLQLMKMVAEHTKRMADDTTLTYPMMQEALMQDVSMVMQSVQRDEIPENAVISVPAITSITPAPELPAKPEGRQPVIHKKPEKKSSTEKIEAKKVTKPENKKPPPDKTKESMKQPNRTPKAVMPKQHSQPNNDY